MNWYEISISSFTDISEEINVFFGNFGITDMVTEDPAQLQNSENEGLYWDYVEGEGVLYDHEDIRYKLYAELEDSDIESFKLQVDSFLSNLVAKAELLAFKEIDATEGLDEWKKYFVPFEICDGVVICPSWEEYFPKPSEIVIKMDPSGAFGTGTHETTSMCANLIADYIRNNSDKNYRMLDVGTGSGILSILALKLGVESSVGVEIDEHALEIALENAELNAVGDGFIAQGSEEDYGNGYDIVVANLIAPIIIDLFDRLKLATRQGGIIVLSGVISSADEDIQKTFGADGFELVEHLTDNEWHAYLYRCL